MIRLQVWSANRHTLLSLLAQGQLQHVLLPLNLTTLTTVSMQCAVLMLCIVQVLMHHLYCTGGPDTLTS